MKKESHKEMSCKASKMPKGAHKEQGKTHKKEHKK